MPIKPVSRTEPLPVDGPADVAALVEALTRPGASDIGTTYHLRRGTPERPRSTLTLYAVRSETRAGVRDALTTGNVLDDACAWLAAAERADPTWLDKTHTWTAYLHRGALLHAEETGP